MIKDEVINTILEFYEWAEKADPLRREALEWYGTSDLICGVPLEEFCDQFCKKSLAFLIFQVNGLTDSTWDVFKEPLLKEALAFAGIDENTPDEEIIDAYIDALKECHFLCDNDPNYPRPNFVISILWAGSLRNPWERVATRLAFLRPPNSECAGK